MFEHGQLAFIADDLQFVKDPGGLLTLRGILYDNLGPPLLWIFMLSPLEWATLTDEQKEMHASMRDSWVSSFPKNSEVMLQHWLWKLLRDKTVHFGPLHEVFTKVSGNTKKCSTDAWTQIFTYYTVSGDSIVPSFSTVVIIKLRHFGRSKSCTHQSPLFACVSCRLSPYARHKGVASSTQSCSRRGRGIVEDMCYERRRAEACVD
jgi:hypothetical protein